VFATPSLKILGHTISATGAAPTSDAQIKNCPPPQDIKQLQCFLGRVNFYCRFLPKCAQILKPLTDLLKGGADPLEWTVSAQEAFQNAKLLWAALVPLQHPAPNAELSLATDASDTHIGGVMQQKSGDHWGSLGFFSCKLTDTESHYSTFDRELLAAHAAIFAKVEISTLDRSQTTCHCLFSCFSPHFTQPTVPFGIHFRVECANVVFAWFDKCHCRFFVLPKSSNHWISRCCFGDRPSGF
jgi:hypothetical protein